MESRYNTRSPAVKRLMREAQELSEPTDQYYAQPLEDNLFEWHFTVRGPADSDFHGGIYHGRIILPMDYPMKPPSIIWLTPNGRFETNKKICLSISGHHPESWQPSWSIRTALLAIIGFMPTHSGGAIGSLDYKPEERKGLAKKSRDWKCQTCGDIANTLLEPGGESSQTSQEAKELASQIAFQGEKPKVECPVESTAVCTTIASPTTTTGSDVQGSSNNSTNTSGTDQQQQPQPTMPFSCQPTYDHVAQAMATGTPIHNPMAHPFLHAPWTSPMMAGGSPECGIASMIPQFPYPPSHYPGGYSMPFYPPGLAPPPGVGMFPCPLPPLPGTRVGWSQTIPYMIPPMPIPISVNNSSSMSNMGQESPESPVMQRSSNRSTSSPPSSGPRAAVNTAGSPSRNPQKDSVLSELLSKVKRVGSDVSSSVDQPLPGLTDPNAIQDVSVKEDFSAAHEKMKNIGPCEQVCLEGITAGMHLDHSEKEENAALISRSSLYQLSSSDVDTGIGELSSVPRVHNQVLSFSKSEQADKTVEKDTKEGIMLPEEAVCDRQFIAGDRSLVEEGDSKKLDSMQGATDSEISLSLKKKESVNELTGTEISHSELPPDAEENSEAGDAAVEVLESDQRSNFEKSTSSSMSNLEKMLKPGTIKGLRQRQSATARIPQDVSEEAEVPDHNVPAVGQRIEAASGDTSNRFQQRLLRPGTRAIDEVRLVHREALAQVRQRHSPYDASFLLMVGLCLATVFILLNRAFSMINWADISFSEFL